MKKEITMKKALKKQRRIGAALILLGIASTLIDGDATAAAFLLPLGVAVMAAKEGAIYDT